MEWIDNVLRDVAELPDRNSPEDWPEAMLVTGAELRQIIVAHAPAEPVNAQLLGALRGCLEHMEYSTQQGRHAFHEAQTTIAAADAQQERLLQDMHDAGREIDRVMAEPARMTDEEIAAELNLFPQPSNLVLKIARAIETAVLRKNGIEVAE